MTQALRFFLIVVFGGLVLLAANVFFTVREDRQAIVLLFGKPEGGAINKPDQAEGAPGPGLHMKNPLATVVEFDRRNLEFDLPDPAEIIVANEQRLRVDAFVRYQITEPLIYYQTLSAAGTDSQRMRDRFEQRLAEILEESMRGQLGGRTISAIINTQRDATMQAITNDVTREVRDLGVRVIDVRIRQADFPLQNAQKVHERMKSDYNQQAEQIRAAGEAQARNIRAQANERVVTITSRSEEASQVMRGRADAIANCIFANAYQGVGARIEPASAAEAPMAPEDAAQLTLQELLDLDLDAKVALLEAKLPLTCDYDDTLSRQDGDLREEFFRFYRSMNSYNRFGESPTTILLRPDSDFFEYFNSADGADN